MKLKIIILMMLTATVAFGQITGGSDESSFLKSGLDESSSFDSKMFESEQLPVSNILNPDKYYLGPGDILMIKALPMLTTAVPVVVSPDNKILLPRSGGLIDVNGKTLTEARELINESFTKYKSDAIVTVSFQKPHLCFITVEGNVVNSDVYNLLSTFKVSDVIQLANKRANLSQLGNATEDNYIQERLRVKRGFSKSEDLGVNINYWKRNILIIHEDGTSSNVDLVKSNIEGSFSSNPYIKQGDRIIVPFDKKNYSTISIKGEVNRPATIPYKRNDKLSDLVKYGLGLTDDADYDNIYYSDGKTKVKLEVENNNIIIDSDVKLMPGSTLIVGSKRDRVNTEEGVVTVKGMVNNPGAYPIINSKTKLSEIITMAGGLTNEAYLPLAKVYRSTNEFDDLSQSRTEAFKMFRKSNLTMEDTVRYTLDLKSIEPIVSVDFTKALNESSHDIVLVNGDEVVIPNSPNRVYVFGRVENPGFVEFSQDQDVAYYIKKTGGYTDVADDGRTAVIRKNTTAWIGDEDAIVYDGDYIYVPGEEDLSAAAEQAQYSTYAAIAGTVATLGFLVLQVINFVNESNKDE